MELVNVDFEERIILVFQPSERSFEQGIHVSARMSPRAFSISAIEG